MTRHRGGQSNLPDRYPAFALAPLRLDRAVSTIDQQPDWAVIVPSVLTREFAFLSDFGYRLTAASATGADWLSERRSVRLIRDPRDTELYSRLSLGDTDLPESFSVDDALVVVGAVGAIPSHGWATPTSETFEKFASQIADAMSTRLRDFLTGDASAWREAQAVAASKGRAYWEDMNARQLRARANAARSAEDWPTVANVYEEMLERGHSLTEAERARLAVAHERRSGAE